MCRLGTDGTGGMDGMDGMAGYRWVSMGTDEYRWGLGDRQGEQMWPDLREVIVQSSMSSGRLHRSMEAWKKKQNGLGGGQPCTEYRTHGDGPLPGPLQGPL